MNQLMKIQNAEIRVKEYQGKRVVTFKDIDVVHQRPDSTTRRSFNTNRKRFIQDEDYFVRNTYEAKQEYGIVAPNGLILITESGYMMLVKSFTDDLAWTVQRALVNNYFRKSEPKPELKPKTERQKLEESYLDSLKSADDCKEVKEYHYSKYLEHEREYRKFLDMENKFNKLSKWCKNQIKKIDDMKMVEMCSEIFLKI